MSWINRLAEWFWRKLYGDPCPIHPANRAREHRAIYHHGLLVMPAMCDECYRQLERQAFARIMKECRDAAAVRPADKE